MTKMYHDVDLNIVIGRCIYEVFISFSGTSVTFTSSK